MLQANQTLRQLDLQDNELSQSTIRLLTEAGSSSEQMENLQLTDPAWDFEENMEDLLYEDLIADFPDNVDVSDWAATRAAAVASQMRGLGYGNNLPKLRAYSAKKGRSVNARADDDDEDGGGGATPTFLTEEG